MKNKKGVSPKRLADRRMLEKKTKAVVEKVKKSTKLKEEEAVLARAGQIPKGKRFSKLMVLTRQKEFLAVEDPELSEAIYRSYKLDSKQGRTDSATIREKGDKGRSYLYFTDVRRCPREVNFMFYFPYKARDYTPKGLMLFDDGNIHHKNIQRRLEDQKKAKNPEGELIEPESGAVGYYDGLVNVDYQGGWQICDLLEIKTKNPYAMETITQEDYDQAQLYHHSALFSPTLQRKRIRIRKIRILYRDRALMCDDPLNGWLVDPDPERKALVLKYMKWLKVAVVDNRYLCPHPFDRDSDKCQYCRWNSWCWKGYPAPPEKSLLPDPTVKKLPEQQLLESLATRFLEISKEQGNLKKEKEDISKVIINYLAMTKKETYPASESKALKAIIQIEKGWKRDYLLENLGTEIFAQIANPNSQLIEAFIEKGIIDAGIFEFAKSWKKRAPYLTIVNRKEGDSER